MGCRTRQPFSIGLSGILPSDCRGGVPLRVENDRAALSLGATRGTVSLMALDDERCCFCRRVVRPQEWTDRPGWLEVECPICGLFRAERQFWVAAHFQKARKPVLYRRLAQWLAEDRDRARPPEIPFEGWDTVAGPSGDRAADSR